MGEFIIRRLILMIPTVFVISIISFIIIQLAARRLPDLLRRHPRKLGPNR